MEILPGEITDPDWRGGRCSGCGRPLGEGFNRCSQYAEEGLPSKPHLTMESVSVEQKTRYFTDRAWGNATQELPLLDAIEWLAAPRVELGGATPVSLLRAGQGASVLQLQYAEWPRLAAIEAGVQNRMASFA